MLTYALMALAIVVVLVIIVNFIKSIMSGLMSIVIVGVALFVLNYLIKGFTGTDLWGVIFK